MAARKSSLRDLAAKSRRDGLAAANTGPVAGRIAELDPSLVHAGGLQDRIEVSQEEIATLAKSIQQAGQKVPILVRPHPDKPGEFEIVAGRRRLVACKLAGLNVRAEIQDLNDHDLVMGQAIENIAREDLTYIERARLAVRMTDEAGISPTDIDIAFSCGKTDRSRYLKIGRGVPDDILAFVGNAPGVGRPRWERLVAHMEADKTAHQRMRDVLAAANIADEGVCLSDDRFTLIFDAAFEAEATPRKTQTLKPVAEDIWINSHNKPVGTIKRTGSGVQLTLRSAPHPGFLDWLALNGGPMVEQMLQEYEAYRMIEDLSAAVKSAEGDDA